MPRLVIEYVLEGYAPGYNFTTPTNGFDDETLKAVWRSAFPRGQVWGSYAGARSLKCFSIKDNLHALSHVSVTDMQDEAGRKGIRRAEIELFTTAACIEHLSARFKAYPSDVHARLAQKPPSSEWRSMIDHVASKSKGEAQAILAHPFRNADEWQLMEALVIKLVLERVGAIKKWGKLASFTTLALDYRNESRIVAIPQKLAESVKSPIISVT